MCPPLMCPLPMCPLPMCPLPMWMSPSSFLQGPIAKASGRYRNQNDPTY
jgi:hypothetical protein